MFIILALTLLRQDDLKILRYIYYGVSIRHYWDIASDLFDSLTISVLSADGLLNIMEEPYYNPLKDKRIQNGVTDRQCGKLK